MNGKITTITEYYRIGVLAIAVIANGTFGILLFSLASGLSVDSSRTTRSGSVCLWRFGVRLGNAWNVLAKYQRIKNLVTDVFPTHATPSRSE